MLRLLLTLFFAPMVLSAQEPGYLRNEDLPKPTPKPKPNPAKPPLASPPGVKTPAPEPPPAAPAKKAVARTMMSEEFAKARGLSEGDIRGMHYNRVACARRMFSPDGWLINGDADIKVTNVAGDYLEAEMPAQYSFVAFGGFNPYMNGVSEVTSALALQLVHVKKWPEGKPLRLKKFVEVRFVDENRQPQIVPAIDEVRMLTNAYPPTYLVRETVFLDKPFSLYFFCQ